MSAHALRAKKIGENAPRATLCEFLTLNSRCGEVVQTIPSLEKSEIQGDVNSKVSTSVLDCTYCLSVGLVFDTSNNFTDLLELVT